MPLEDLINLRNKRFPGLSRGDFRRIHNLCSLLTNSGTRWDNDGNLITTDPHLLMSDKDFEKDSYLTWKKIRESKLKDLEFEKQYLLDDIQKGYDPKYQQKAIKKLEHKIKKYFTVYNPYQDEFEDMENEKEKVTGVADIRYNFVGYGTLENIPDNAQEESIEIIMEYLDYVVNTYDDVSQEVKDIRKNVVGRFYRHKKIDELLS